MKAIRLSGTIVAGAIAFAAFAASAQTKEVVIYTAAPGAVVDALTDRYAKETGVKVQVVKAGSGDLIRRVRAEAAAPKADVIWSVGGEQLESNKDLLAEFTTAEDAAILPAYKISKAWSPYSGILAVFSVNTKLLKPEQYPKSWKDLADPRWKGKITSARADASGSAFQQYATVLTIYGNEGPAIYKAILDNINFATSSGVVNRLVNDGEAAVGITLEDDAMQYKKNGGPIEIVMPGDGTSTVPDGMALIKGAPSPEEGKKFMNWVLSKPVQDYVVKETNRRSARIDTPFPGTPITAIKTIDYDILKIAAQRDELLKQWRAMAVGR